MTSQTFKEKITFLSAALRKVFSLMGTKERISVLVLAIIALTDILYLGNSVFLHYTKNIPTNGGRYREGLLGQPRLINPLIATTPADQALVHLVYSGLYTYDEAGNIIPDLAENLPQISDDKKQYTIHLRKGATWHNGKPVTANDVLFTVHTLQNADYASPLRSLWLNTTVSKTDDTTVIFSNKDISAPFINNLTLPILPETVWANVPASNFLLSSANLEAVGSGPYTIREINKLPNGKIQSIRLESYSNFYKGKPYLDTIQTFFYDSYEDLVTALQSKAIDGFGYVSLDTTLQLSKNHSGVSYYTIPLPQYQGAFFNTKNAVLSDKIVRQALQTATDTASIRNTVFGGVGLPISGPVLAEQLHQQNTDADKAPDVATAASLLDSVGWKVVPETGMRAKNKTPFSITITTNDFPLNAKTAQSLADQWKQLHIDVKLNIVNTKDLTGSILTGRNYDVLVFALKLNADPDPFVFWHSSQAKDPGLNVTQFASSEADKLITDARNTLDFSVRQTKYADFEQIIAREVPAVFIVQTVYVYAMRDEIQGMHTTALYDPAYRFTQSYSWYSAEKRIWK